MNFKFKKKLSVIAISSVLTLGGLAGCDNSGPINAPVVDLRNASGDVSLGPIVGATVKFKGNGGKEVTLSGVTNEKGHYDAADIDLAGFAFPIIVTLSGGTDAFTNALQIIDIKTYITEGQSSADVKNLIANANFFTTVALDMALDGKDLDTISAEDLKVAVGATAAKMTILQKALGIPLAFDPASTDTSGDNNKLSALATANEVLAEVIKRAAVDSTSSTAGVTAESVNSVITSIVTALEDGEVAPGELPEVEAAAAAVKVEAASAEGLLITSPTGEPVSFNTAMTEVVTTFNPNALLETTLKLSSKIAIHDFDDSVVSDSSKESTDLGVTTLGSVILDQANVDLLIANNGGVSPTVSFTFDPTYKVTNSDKGKMTLTVLDGSDATRELGERQMMVALPIEWGGSLARNAIQVEDADVTVSFYTADATEVVELTIPNAEVNFVNSSDRAGQQGQMNLALTALFSNPTLSAALDGIGSKGNYFYKVNLGTLPVLNMDGVVVNSVQGTFSVGN